MLACIALAAVLSKTPAVPELAYSSSTSGTIALAGTCTENACFAACDAGCGGVPWCLVGDAHCQADGTCYCWHVWFPPYPGARAPSRKAKTCQDKTWDATWQQ